jgi:hypothetical protein
MLINVKSTAALKSPARVFSHQNPTLPSEGLQGRLAKHVGAVKGGATWESLLSRTLLAPNKLMAAASSVPEQQQGVLHILQPDLAAPSKVQPSKTSLKHDASVGVPGQFKPQQERTITFCPRRHNPKTYQHSIQIAHYSNAKTTGDRDALNKTGLVIGAEKSILLGDSAQGARVKQYVLS